jgi:hypothetical protein
MSCDRCWKCSEIVDTDGDPDCYIPFHSLGRTEYYCYCEPCRDEHFAICDHCGEYVGHDEIVPGTEWCSDCTDAEVDKEQRTSDA